MPMLRPASGPSRPGISPISRYRASQKSSELSGVRRRRSICRLPATSTADPALSESRARLQGQYDSSDGPQGTGDPLSARLLSALSSPLRWILAPSPAPERGPEVWSPTPGGGEDAARERAPAGRGGAAPASPPAARRAPLLRRSRSSQRHFPAPSRPATPRPEGSGEEVLLQGFNWDSCRSVPHLEGNWWERLELESGRIASMGFTAVWLPPPTSSVSAEGYLPRDLYDLSSSYGDRERLRRAVRALRSHGLLALGDAVLNHRCADSQDSRGRWNVFGGRLDWDASAIVGDDRAYGGRGSASSGTSFHAAPNLDHSSPRVKGDLSEWLRWLRTDVGFDGWRLDFVRGFHGSHVSDYVRASAPHFVVGEYWDALSYGHDGLPSRDQDAHRQRLVDWVHQARGESTAFDTTTKGVWHAAAERCEYDRLADRAGRPPGLVGWWPSRAVTFLENHDTGSTQGHWRFPRHAVEQGYAYLLTHPGTPAVFWDHAMDEGADARGPHVADAIRRLIHLRRRHRIHCRSPVHVLEARSDCYAASIAGRVVVKVGPGSWRPHEPRLRLADSGHEWAVWETTNR